MSGSCVFVSVCEVIIVVCIMSVCHSIESHR